MTADELIVHFKLRPHPEGGFFSETYRSAAELPASAVWPGLSGDRALSTGILFLLPRGSRSRLHRLLSDEMWHFYLGGPLEIIFLKEPEGQPESVVLGQDIGAGQRLQYVVPAGTWFGAAPLPGVEYSLVGCTVAPGFDFADFELARRADLSRQFPHHAELIERWTEEEG